MGDGHVSIRDGRNRRGAASRSGSGTGRGRGAGDSGKTCDGLPMIERLHSAIVLVADLETATRDYARLLGQPAARVETDLESGLRSSFFGLANTGLELREATNATRGSEQESKEGKKAERLGQAGLRFVCDLDDPTAVLSAQGIEISKSEQCVGRMDGGALDRCYGIYVLDRAASRGNSVELITGETVQIEPNPEGDIDPAARVRSLDHVVVMSPAPDATRDFYGEGLGLRLALDKSFEKRGVRLIFFRVGGTTVEIGAKLKVDPQPEKSDRFGGLAWQVPDIDAFQARLAADGFDVSEVRTGHKEGTRVCTVRDPVHGVPTLIIEPVQDASSNLGGAGS